MIRSCERKVIKAKWKYICKMEVKFWKINR